ncbi:MAG: chloride channel protein [Clostridia bacterium]|nr:chloride channel protein [Clostridia bacterium]
MKRKSAQKRHNVYRNALELVGVGGVTGIFAGAVVGVYNLLVKKGEALAHDAYAFIRENPAFLPLLLLTLVLGAFFIGVIVRLAPEVKGCGIPQAEGSSRGVIRLNWLRDMTAMFAASLISIFMGLSVGSEGPSVQIGATVGDGVSKGLRRNEMIRRYQVTGGACAGLAVASNAPLTGMAFAFEETHKRFTPEVFICAFSSVIFGCLTREAIFSAFGISSVSAFHSFVLFELPLRYYPYVAISAAVCALVGVAFYKAVFFVRRLYRKFTLKSARKTDFVKIFSAVLTGGVISFVAAGAMGGGHELIEAMGTLGGAKAPTVESVFSLPLVWTLLIVFILKLVSTCLNLGAGLPCGIFLPIIAMGACLGGLMTRAWLSLGMDSNYADLLVMICMATFFTAIVKAPITGIIMVCELTWSFAPLLPLIIGVSIGYILGDVFRTNGIYDELLEEYERETGVKERQRRVRFTLTVAKNSVADKREIRDVLWPSGAIVTDVLRDGVSLHPNGSTLLKAGDVLSVVCRTLDVEKAKEELLHLTGSEDGGYREDEG